jgi:tetratricopeptide (TPR) repeat protein
LPKTHRSSGIASVLQNRAELDFAMGRHTRAHQTVTTALAVAKQCGSAEATIDCAELLAKIATHRGDHQQAAHYIRLALAFAEKAWNRRRMRELAAQLRTE